MPVFPIDLVSDRPEIPYSERIFAASKEVFDAYQRGEEWSHRVPLHEAYVLFFLEMTNDAIGDLINRWKTNGMVGEFPDALAVQDELKRIICLEDKQAAATARRQEACT
jgi:hypothetical protein